MEGEEVHKFEDSMKEGELIGLKENMDMVVNSEDSSLAVLKEGEIRTDEVGLDGFGVEGDKYDEAAVDGKTETEVEAAIDGEEHGVGVYSPIGGEIEKGVSVEEMKSEVEELQVSKSVGLESVIVEDNKVLEEETMADLESEEETLVEPVKEDEEENLAEPHLEDETFADIEVEEDTQVEPLMEEVEEYTQAAQLRVEEEAPVEPQFEEEETRAEPLMEDLEEEEEEETRAKPLMEDLEEEETRAEPLMEDVEEEEAAESNEEEEGKGSGDEVDDSQLVGAEEDEDLDEAMVANEETPVDTEMETETEAAELGKASGGKRKRGKNSKGNAKASVSRKKTVEEDVCFICFDGGELVLCDRRGCPKAYHPGCVNRDEAFFRAKGRWNCGWHQCSICEKNAHYMCYTCTYSLCKGCIKDAVILCVRGNKGFCESCMKTVMLIENEDQGHKEVQVDFNDRSSWEYLFKDYWLETKEKLSLSPNEIAQAKIPRKGSDTTAGKQGSPDEQLDTTNAADSVSENSSESVEEQKPKKRRGRKLSKSLPKEQSSTSETKSKKTSTSSINTEWASNELLEVVMHMRNGDKSVLSQFDVQAMLLEYIKKNKLRDPRRKSQIICDARLQNLFGKARVGHFEMLKLLESHFLIKEDAQIDDVQGSVVDTDSTLLDADGSADLTKGGKDKKRKTRRKGSGPQSNLEDYAAIDTHNISLIYLRRKLMEDLLDDDESFSEKVVGTFVRIRIPGNNQKQDIYRLVQVVGTSKADSPYKVGNKRITDIMLEILNLDKNEVVTIDSISNQEFTEDECKRLRQSIKCGLINRLTVGDILEKATEIQAARVNDWIETETMRLSHLRDRASETGRRKELRECVEKLQLLKTPEERRRRQEEIAEIHADPKMDPGYESEDNGSEMEEDTKQDMYTRPRGSSFNRRPREPISPGRGSDFSPKDSWSGNRKHPGKNWELNRNLSNKNLPIKTEDSTGTNFNDNSWNQRQEKEALRENNIETFGPNTHSTVRSEPSPQTFTTPVVPAAAKINETEKMWHYKDPSGKAQGPFSIVQLRKWSNTGYFPADLKIWRTGKESELILLTDALAGRFPADTSPAAIGERNMKSSGSFSDIQDEGDRVLRSRVSPVEVSKISLESSRPTNYSSMDGLSNLPSPTPKQSSTGWTGGTLQSPTPHSTQSLHSSSSISPAAASKEYNMTPSLGATLAPTLLLNSGGQSVGVSANTPMNSNIGFGAVAPVGDSHGASSFTHPAPVPAPEPAANMVQSVNSQNSVVGTQGWVNSTLPQNLTPTSMVNMPGQLPAYAQWSGSEPWRPPPVQGNQMNMQPQLQPNVPWGMGPDNQNAGWVGMQGNLNMGWVGQVPPGNTNMNWGFAVQPGNVNPGWVVPQTGAQGFVPGNMNPGWVAPPNNQPWVAPNGPAPGNANPGWAPTNPVVANVQAANANQGWVGGTGNAGGNNIQGPVTPPVNQNQNQNQNQGWGSPAANRGPRRNESNHHGERFSGRRDRDNRNWNRQSSFGNGGSGGSSRSSPRGPSKVCLYYENGKCRKGSSCDFKHN